MNIIPISTAQIVVDQLPPLSFIVISSPSAHLHSIVTRAAKDTLQDINRIHFLIEN